MLMRPTTRWLARFAVALLTAAPTLHAQPRLLKLSSQVLGETRVVHVHLPRDYALAKQRYPVVVVLDGQVRAFVDLAVAAADYDLTSEQFPVGMPRQIVVAVEHADRGVDLGSNAEAFLRFLTSELLPRIDREYRTLPFRTLIGHSRGGAFALRAACRASDAFPAIVAISASLTDSLEADVVRCLLADSAAQGQRHLFLSAGALEPRALAATARLTARLRERPLPRWRVQQVEGSGLEHTGAPLIGIPLGLRFVFDPGAWDLPQPFKDSLARGQGDPDRVLAAGLEVLSARLGFAVPASARLLSAVVRTWLSRGDRERALASARDMLARYPEEILSHTLLADACELAGDAIGARKAIQSALDMSGRIAWHDETQKARFQADMRKQLAARTP
ncbi:MAG: hypothetical protein LCH84_14310 [Gemmatimonadetes bacterium]|nr:hypothetical protein [Gemmatimonadota bacterium]